MSIVVLRLAIRSRVVVRMSESLRLAIALRGMMCIAFSDTLTSKDLHLSLREAIRSRVTLCLCLAFSDTFAYFDTTLIVICFFGGIRSRIT